MSERDYWDARYRTGKNSGHQSHKKWEQNIIFPYLDIMGSVLDVGCGDLDFWNLNLPFSYTGIDISPYIIAQNKKLHPEETFICGDITTLELSRHYDVVICLNVVYHLMQDDITPVIKRLFDATDKHFFISNWVQEPQTYDQRYQRHHELWLPNLPHEAEAFILENFILFHIDKEIE